MSVVYRIMIEVTDDFEEEPSSVVKNIKDMLYDYDYGVRTCSLESVFEAVDEE